MDRDPLMIALRGLRRRGARRDDEASSEDPREAKASDGSDGEPFDAGPGAKAPAVAIMIGGEQPEKAEDEAPPIETCSLCGDDHSDEEHETLMEG